MPFWFMSHKTEHNRVISVSVTHYQTDSLLRMTQIKRAQPFASTPNIGQWRQTAGGVCSCRGQCPAKCPNSVCNATSTDYSGGSCNCRIRVFVTGWESAGARVVVAVCGIAPVTPLLSPRAVYVAIPIRRKFRPKNYTTPDRNHGLIRIIGMYP